MSYSFRSVTRKALSLVSFGLLIAAFALTTLTPTRADNIITAGADKKVKIWDTDGKLVKEIAAHDGAVNAIALSPDGKTLATGGADKKVKLWNTANGELVKSIDAHDGPVTSLFFSADGGKLISGSEDKKIKIWNPADLKDGKPVTTLTPESGTIVGALMIPEPPFIITVGSENKIKIWGEDGNMVFEIDTGHEGGVKSMGGNPKQAMLYSGGADGVLKYWSQGAQGAFEGKQGSAITVIGAFADGSKILSGGADGKVKIWDAESYKEKATVEAHKGGVNAIMVSPDGKLIFTGGADKKVKVWSPDGKMVKEVDAHDGAVTAILYKKDKKEETKEEKKDKP